MLSQVPNLRTTRTKRFHVARSSSSNRPQTEALRASRRRSAVRGPAVRRGIYVQACVWCDVCYSLRSVVIISEHSSGIFIVFALCSERSKERVKAYTRVHLCNNVFIKLNKSICNKIIIIRN